MPIFHDHSQQEQPAHVQSLLPPTWSDQDRFLPMQRSRPASPTLARARLDETHASPEFTFSAGGDGRPLSRGELIDRIKRRESQSPTWRFRQRRGHRTPTTPSPRPSPLASPDSSLILQGKSNSPERGRTRPVTPVHVEEQATGGAVEEDGNESIGLAIERPRSALHSGDFRSDSSGSSRSGDQPCFTPILPASPPAPWAFGGASEHYSERRQHAVSASRVEGRPIRPRASSSLLSNVVLMPSTSPLSQSQWNHSDLDRPIHNDGLLRDSQMTTQSPLISREQRRHTFSPRSFEAFQARCFDESPPSGRSIPGLRREGTYPIQAVQPRRLASANSIQSPSGQWPASYNSPFLPSRARKNSLSQASMVGSFEESILRGRMSSTPSRPLDFIAQIGVLGRGKCKSTLKCPPHVIVPFPAVFYSYNPGNGRISDNQPCPYVGLIDLEHHLKPAEETETVRRPRRRHSPTVDYDDRDTSPTRSATAGNSDSTYLKVKRDALRRRSRSPPRKAPPGGCYRIPQQGQLQVILKNPNKTAVKLFLIPYDLSDMEPGTKTFIRQRSYSAGPIIDMPLTSRKNLGTDRPEASLSTSEDPADRPVLRYLIHLHICCPAKGRYYLYKSIRVVFANRVPDGKEKLRNEVQLPEPRYSAYKPGRDSVSSSPGHGLQPMAGAQSPFSPMPLSQEAMAERVARRRSTQISFASQMRMQDTSMAEYSPTHGRSGFQRHGMDTMDGLEGDLSMDPASQNYASASTRHHFSEPRRNYSEAHPTLHHGQSDVREMQSSPIRPIPFILSPIQSRFFIPGHGQSAEPFIHNQKEASVTNTDDSSLSSPCQHGVVADRRDASTAFLSMAGGQSPGLLSRGFKEKSEETEAGQVEECEWEVL